MLDGSSFESRPELPSEQLVRYCLLIPKRDHTKKTPRPLVSGQGARSCGACNHASIVPLLRSRRHGQACHGIRELRDRVAEHYGKDPVQLYLPKPSKTSPPTEVAYLSCFDLITATRRVPSQTSWSPPLRRFSAAKMASLSSWPLTTSGGPLMRPF